MKLAGEGEGICIQEQEFQKSWNGEGRELPEDTGGHRVHPHMHLHVSLKVEDLSQLWSEKADSMGRIYYLIAVFEL